MFVSVHLNAYSQFLYFDFSVFSHVYKVWAKCNFVFKKIAQIGQVDLYVVKAAPLWKSSEWYSWLMWENKIVCMMGLYHWNTQSTGGRTLNCSALCGSRSLCLSLRSPLSLSESLNISGLKIKGLGLMSFGTLSTLGFCEDWAWMLQLIFRNGDCWIFMLNQSTSHIALGVCCFVNVYSI